MSALALGLAALAAVLALGDPLRYRWAVGALGLFLGCTGLLWGAVQQLVP